MKTFWTLILLALIFWSSPVLAEFCTVDPESNSTSCVFKTKRTSKDSQVIVSYTQQGWSMVVEVYFKKDFAMIEGDSKVTLKDGETFDLKYVSTRRDLTLRRKMLEAPVYIVGEDLLNALSNAKGKVQFWLTAEKPKEVEAEFSSGLFEDLDAYIAETKMVMSELFEDQ